MKSSDLNHHALLLLLKVFSLQSSRLEDNPKELMGEKNTLKKIITGLARKNSLCLLSPFSLSLSLYSPPCSFGIHRIMYL